MTGIELVWFDLQYAAKQVFFHIPRECGTFWWIFSSSFATLTGGVITAARRLSSRRRKHHLQAVAGTGLNARAPQRVVFKSRFAAKGVGSTTVFVTLTFLASIAALTPSARAQCINWAQRGGPLARSFHTMVYDSARGVTVLFGGVSRSFIFADTWELDSRGWIQRTPATSPSWRYGHAMAYDSGRGVTVLFGGQAYGSCDPNGETWEWDGTNWTQRFPTTSPPTRRYAAMAYDSVHGVTVLFGGENGGGCQNDTLEWNGTDWMQRNPATSPPGRSVHVMAYDSARQVIVLFGGDTCSGPASTKSDTWEWDGTNWAQRNPTSHPAGRILSAMAYDFGRRVTVLFCGLVYSGNPGHYDFAGDTWEWNGSLWTRASPSSSPAARAALAMAHDSTRGVAVLFGGYDRFSDYSDTWAWNGATWTPRDLVARGGHAMVYESARGVTLLFGGSGSSLFGDTWEWNGTRWLFQSDAGPGPRQGHAMAYDSARGRAVLFGGTNYFGNQFYGDTWEWDGSAWTLRATTGPLGRSGHLMAYDSLRNRVVLFGGFNGNGGNVGGETWEWDGTAWSLRANTGPPGHSAMTFDSVRGRLVLFCDGSGYHPDYGETWEWDGNSWEHRANSRPSQRFAHAMAYDSTRHRTILYGGEFYSGNDHFEDTWEWDGTTWRQLSPMASPGFRYGHQMAFDSARAVTVLFGGLYGANDTWELSGSLGAPIITQQPIYGTACVGSTLTITVGAEAPGNPELTHQWFHNYAPLANGGNISGATSAVLTISPVTGNDGGDYHAVITDTCGSVTSYSAGVTICVPADIKPADCPNLFNRYSHGIMTMAIVGSANLDVNHIDVTTLRLSQGEYLIGSVPPHEGPPGPHTTITDVATSFSGAMCGCNALGADGWQDLLLHFKVDELVPPLDLNSFDSGALVDLRITGNFDDGSPFFGSDCIRLVPASAANGALHIEAGAGNWIECSPPDLSLDGGGFGSFHRQYPETSIVTLTAPSQTQDSRVFTGWRINGAIQPDRSPVLRYVMPATDSEIAATYSPFPRGDLNCDGVTDGRDIAIFIQALLTPANYANAYPNCSMANVDFNGDNQVTTTDVPSFTQALLGF